MKLRMGGKYKTLAGHTVRRVLCIDGANPDYPVVVELSNGMILMLTEDGRDYTGHTSPYLVEITPYSDFKVDEPVMVRKSEDSVCWHRGYFAAPHAEGVLAWADGRTSWTAGTLQYPKNYWAHCRRPTTEELGTVFYPIEGVVS